MRGKFNDLTGQRFGSLTVLERTNEKSGKSYKWQCRCDCGEITRVASNSLTSGHTTRCFKCGKKHMGKINIKDLSGLRFGNLTVLEITNEKRGRNYKWLCRCDCGALIHVVGSYLTSGVSARCRACGYKHAHETNTRFSFEEVNIRNCMSRARSDARRANRSFGLTNNEYVELIFQDCFYCGAKPSNFSKTSRLGDPGILYNGIDRVDNSKGYITSNCVPCCWQCNQYKHHVPIDWILNAAKRLREGYEIDNGWCATSEFEEDCVKAILRNYKGRAKYNNRNFSLTFEQVGALVANNCFYCGKSASESEKIMNGEKVPYHGIDRIDNDKGYEVDNVVPCCSECNYLKHHTPLEWLFNAAEKLEAFAQNTPKTIF